MNGPNDRLNEYLDTADLAIELETFEINEDIVLIDGIAYTEIDGTLYNLSELENSNES